MQHLQEFSRLEKRGGKEKKKKKGSPLVSDRACVILAGFWILSKSEAGQGARFWLLGQRSALDFCFIGTAFPGLAMLDAVFSGREPQKEMGGQGEAAGRGPWGEVEEKMVLEDSAKPVPHKDPPLGKGAAGVTLSLHQAVRGLPGGLWHHWP